MGEGGGSEGGRRGGQSRVEEAAELATDGVSKDDVFLGWVGRVGGGDPCPRGCTLLLLGQFLGEEGEVCAHCFQSPIGQSFAPLGTNYPPSRWHPHGPGEGLGLECLTPRGSRATQAGAVRSVVP